MQSDHVVTTASDSIDIGSNDAHSGSPANPITFSEYVTGLIVKVLEVHSMLTALTVVRQLMTSTFTWAEEISERHSASRSASSSVNALAWIT